MELESKDPEINQYSSHISRWISLQTVEKYYFVKFIIPCISNQAIKWYCNEKLVVEKWKLNTTRKHQLEMSRDVNIIEMFRIKGTIHSSNILYTPPRFCQGVLEVKLVSKFLDSDMARMVGNWNSVSQCTGNLWIFSHSYEMCDAFQYTSALTYDAVQVMMTFSKLTEAEEWNLRREMQETVWQIQRCPGDKV